MEDIRVIVLSEENLPKYEHLIPDRLQSAKKNENMIALGVLGPEEISMGIAVFREYKVVMACQFSYVCGSGQLPGSLHPADSRMLCLPRT